MLTRPVRGIRTEPPRLISIKVRNARLAIAGAGDGPYCPGSGLARAVLSDPLVTVWHRICAQHDPCFPGKGGADELPS